MSDPKAYWAGEAVLGSGGVDVWEVGQQDALTRETGTQELGD